jgi:hypothetical protein
MIVYLQSGAYRNEMIRPAACVAQGFPDHFRRSDSACGRVENIIASIAVFLGQPRLFPASPKRSSCPPLGSEFWTAPNQSSSFRNVERQPFMGRIRDYRAAVIESDAQTWAT